MFEMNWQNALIVLLVAVVAYLVYKKVEGFADEKKHHHHHTGHHGAHHHDAHHAKGEHHGSKWIRMPQMDFGGNFDLYNKPSTSVEACEELCNNEPMCALSTFDGNSTCYLKTPNALNGHYLAGIKRNDNSYARYINSDLSGFDVTGSGNPQPTLEACESACNKTQNCVSYTYGTQNQACYLKGPRQNSTPGLTLSLKP